MTNMAQEIDDQNKKLMTKNQDLLIQFKSQDADRDLLLKQIIYYKKQSQ